MKITFRRVVQQATLALCIGVSVSCSGNAGRATEYPEGTPIEVILSDLGPPFVDRPLDRTNTVDLTLCPAETVRIVQYGGPWVSRWLHDPFATLCVDKANRMIRALFSVS